MFLGGANLSVACGTIVLRKGYGLGAQAMAGGGFKAPLFTVGWPTSEFGGMGLEGAVRLGMRRELDAIDDPDERERLFETMVAAAYERGRGLNMAAYGEIDDVIDPAESRRWIAMLFEDDATPWWQRPGKARPYVDAW
jgi:acetyl-CoA carboxylase carboxyltransferase component